MTGNPVEFSRNSGLISELNQERLSNAVVVIAGVGGDGGLVAELLVRLGVGSGPNGEIRLADPDRFGPENINRQAFSNSLSIGRNKSEVLAEQLKLISPQSVKSKPYVNGINAENIEEFIAGADVIIDETDYEKHWIGILIARAARKANIPVFTGLNLAWGTQYTAFLPGGQTMENFLGLSDNDTIAEITAKKVNLSRWVSHLPTYVQYDVFKDVQLNGRTVPSVSPGVALTGGNVATQVYRYLVGMKVVVAPRVGWDDAMLGRRGVVRAPVLAFMYTLAVMYIRSWFSHWSR